MTPQLILIAGPWRGGTHGDPALMAANLARLEAAALDVFRLGHTPIVGEWLSLPLAAQAGSKYVGDAISEAFLYPAAHRMIAHCDAVLRIPGDSRGADADVAVAREAGKHVYFNLAEIPYASSALSNQAPPCTSFP
ncbi:MULTISPECIES: DUF4406 domain-containing protein [unclassified Paraburkholderia]|uniref:DUF4406 domain-containing protein n=1 Tax=unclassified Paraburkholderia TaxID=2615204 RepID=UPI002AB77F44|nr:MULTISPECIES: DUF4406 domain-containing protein [unclassified Paraburkholderia]